jgi:predicted nucleic acid-binding Zn ribbon protein
MRDLDMGNQDGAAGKGSEEFGLAGIGGDLLKAAARLGMDNPAASARLVKEWERIVGPEVAARAHPVSLRAGVLVVKTTSAAWASELRYLAPEVLRRIAEEVGGGVVTELRPWVAPGPSDEKRGGGRGRRGYRRGPRKPPNPAF